MASLGGFSFGAPATTAAPIAGANFGLGSNTTQAGISTIGGGGFQLAQPAAASSGFGGFNLGSTTTTASTASLNPLLAGSGSTATSNTLLGGTTTSLGAGFSFGASEPAGMVAPITSSTAATSGFSFGATTATTGTAAGGFSLGGLKPTTTSTAPAMGGGGFSLGGLGSTVLTTSTGPLVAATTAAASSATTPFNFAGGLGGAPAASTAPSIGLGGSSTPTLGLGGAQPPAAAAGEAAGTKADGKPCKETPLPQEIFATIEAFESFKGVEKAASEANLRQSAAAFHKLGEDCQKLRTHVTQLATLHASLQHRVNALKEKIIRDSEDVEMARRTQNTPGHLQGDNTAPEQYFQQAVEGFEAHMLACRERIEEVEKCLAVAANPSNNDQALVSLVRRQHDDLQVAASHVYTLHAKLIQLSQHLPCPDQLRPRPMFRAGAGDLSKLDDDGTKSAVPKESSVIRSCFDLPGGASRLGTFQMNMARARALSLNPAPPPTQPLQAQQSLFGSGTAFNSGGSNFGLQSNAFGSGNTGSATNFGTGSNFSSGTNFGLGSGTTTSAFGTGTSAFGTGTSTFGTGSTTGFNTGSTNFGTGNNFSFTSPNNNNNSQAGSLFSSTFGQSNKLFSGGDEEARRKRRL